VRIRLFVVVLAAVAAAGCGGSGTSYDTAPTTTTPPTTTRPPVSPAPVAITVFHVDKGLLRPAVVRVPGTRAVAGAALAALGVTAPVSVADGTARIDLAKATDAQVAEIVYTLTQFPTVQRVDVAGRTGLTRDDFASYVPPIFVEKPAAGAEVGQTFQVSGTASVFEATLVVQSLRSGKVIGKQTVTASEGAPGRGTFEATVHATPGALTVQVFAPSAVDGSPQHEVDVSVTVTP
jgi:hypothetical protein